MMDEKRGRSGEVSRGQVVYVKTVQNDKVNWWPAKVVKRVSAVTLLVLVGGVVRF